MTDIPRFKYVVKSFPCNVVEIDHRTIVYWSDKASFKRKEISSLVAILENIERRILAKEELIQAERFEFGFDTFDKANVMFYKTKEILISDGKSGAIPINDMEELRHLIECLKLEDY